MFPRSTAAFLAAAVVLLGAAATARLSADGQDKAATEGAQAAGAQSAGGKARFYEMRTYPTAEGKRW